ELAVVQTNDQPLVARHPDIPAELALQGFDGVRAYAPRPGRPRTLLLDTPPLPPLEPGPYPAGGDRRERPLRHHPPPREPGRGGARTAHHVARASLPAEQEAWQDRVAHAGARPTPVIDRFYFKSVYFREPSGVLFEIATIGPGFTTDEPAEHLGERLSLPPDFEHLRAQVEPLLTPLPNPRG